MIGGGSGTVSFNGKIYGFAIGGVGVDGSAVALLATTGQAYRLSDIALFAGTYRQLSDAAPRPSQDTGGLWIQNEHGVVIHLRSPPQGHIPALRGDILRVVLVSDSATATWDNDGICRTQHQAVA